MILVSAWIMALAVLRDKMALVMTFVLPALLFLVFAVIFSGATGRDLKLKVGVIDLAHSPSNIRLITALKAEKALRIVDYDSANALREAVSRDTLDAALILRGDLAQHALSAPPMLILGDVSRTLASDITMGQIQHVLNEKLPDVVLGHILSDIEAAGAIDPQEEDVLEEAFRKEVAERAHTRFHFSRLVATETVNDREDNTPVLDYAGSVIAIFLLFAATHGGLTIIDERQCGITSRLNLSHTRYAAMLIGKFLYLCVQGVAQAFVVYGVAFAVFHARLDTHRLWLWGLSSMSAAAAAAGVGLAMTAACTTRRQAENVTTFAVLLISAIGGSMVPRYLMPPWLQTFSYLTPNAWTIDAFAQALQTEQIYVLPWLVLIGFALVGMICAFFVLVRRR